MSKLMDQVQSHDIHVLRDGDVVKWGKCACTLLRGTRLCLPAMCFMQGGVGDVLHVEVACLCRVKNASVQFSASLCEQKTQSSNDQIRTKYNIRDDKDCKRLSFAHASHIPSIQAGILTTTMLKCTSTERLRLYSQGNKAAFARKHGCMPSALRRMCSMVVISPMFLGCNVCNLVSDIRNEFTHTMMAHDLNSMAMPSTLNAVCRWSTMLSNGSTACTCMYVHSRHRPHSASSLQFHTHVQFLPR